MPVQQSSDDCYHCGHIHRPDSGGGLKRTHPLRVSFLHSRGHAGTSSGVWAQNNDSNFHRGHAQRQTTPNILGQLPKKQLLHTRSNSHQHLGLIGEDGRIRHYCPFHGPVEPHVHKVSPTQTAHLTNVREDELDSSSSSSDTDSSEGRSESSVEITFKPQSSKLENGHKRPVKRQRKGCWQWSPLRHAMLISCYVLLLLLAVLVGVVVSQSHRLSSRRRQPVQGENVQIRQRPGVPKLPEGPPVWISGRGQDLGLSGGILSRSGGSGRRRRPTTSIPAPPPPPPTTTTTTTTTTTELPVYDYEYDYEYLDTQAASAPVAPSPPPVASTTFRPQPPPITRPVQVVRQQQSVGRPVDRQTFRSGASRSEASDRQTFRSSASSPPRRQGVSLANIDQDFTLNDKTEVRGRKEPTVQIARAWSHQNPDGTFTWGYINTDGSFKNETKGTDCVVRGSYGYVDETTGQEIVVPYETGNPCNPEAQDTVYDYADYDVQGFLKSIRGGAPSNEPSTPVASRRPQQQQFDSQGSLRNRNF